MSAPDLVKLYPRASAAYGLPRASPAGRFWLLGDGQVVRIDADGHVEPLVRGGQPFGRSIASDPGAVRGLR